MTTRNVKTTILNPVIVRVEKNGYEMLAGHNRANAARLAGLKEIPAIVKDGLSDDDLKHLCCNAPQTWDHFRAAQQTQHQS